MNATAWLLAFAATATACSRSAQREGSNAPTTASPTRAGNDTTTVPSSPSGALPRLEGPHVVLRPAGHPPVAVRVEIARTEAQRNRGLMFRRELDEMAGMVFVFPRPRHLEFWMQNTYLPLDMIFITANRRVLGVVRNATPMTEDHRQVPGDSQYVLEVRAGFADRHHITNDTPVEFVEIPAAEPEPEFE